LKVEPLAGTETTLDPEQLSPLVTVKLTLDEQRPGAVDTVMSPGQLMVGGV